MNARTRAYARAHACAHARARAQQIDSVNITTLKLAATIGDTPMEMFGFATMIERLCASGDRDEADMARLLRRACADTDREAHEQAARLPMNSQQRKLAEVDVWQELSATIAKQRRLIDRAFAGHEKLRTLFLRDYFRPMTCERFLRIWQDPNTPQSNAQRAYAEYYNAEDEGDGTFAERVCRYIPKIDEDMSQFGNWAASLMNTLEQQGLSATHQTFTTMWVALLDAARYERDTAMRYELITHGDAGAGKSYMGKALQPNAIHGTIEKCGWQSNLSNTETGTKSGSLQYYDEANVDQAPAAQGGGGGGGRGRGSDVRDKSSTGAGHKKSAVTEGIVQSERMVCIDGRWVTDVQVQGAQYSIISNMNECPGELPVAIRDRCVNLRVQHVHRPRHTPTDQRAKMSLNNENRETKEAIEASKTRLRDLQMLNFLVSMLQLLDVLPQVDMTVMSELNKTLSQSLQKRGLAPPSERHFMRVEFTARIFTIMRALHTMFNSAVGQYTDAERFELSMLMDLDVHLVCTEEEALAAHELLLHDVAFDYEYDLARLVVNKLGKYGTKHAIFPPKRRSGGASGSSGRAGVALTSEALERQREESGTAAYEAAVRKAQADAYDAERARALAAGATEDDAAAMATRASKEAGEAVINPNLDYSRVRIEGTLEQLCDSIKSEIQRQSIEECHIRGYVREIRDILTQWARQTYNTVPCIDAKGTPAKLDNGQMAAPVTERGITVYDYDGDKHLTVLVSLAKMNVDDIRADLRASLEYSGTSERKIVLMQPVSLGFVHFLRVYHIKSTERRRTMKRISTTTDCEMGALRKVGTSRFLRLLNDNAMLDRTLSGEASTELAHLIRRSRRRASAANSSIVISEHVDLSHFRQHWHTLGLGVPRAAVTPHDEIDRSNRKRRDIIESITRRFGRFAEEHNAQANGIIEEAKGLLATYNYPYDLIAEYVTENMEGNVDRAIRTRGLPVDYAETVKQILLTRQSEQLELQEEEEEEEYEQGYTEHLLENTSMPFAELVEMTPAIERHSRFQGFLLGKRTSSAAAAATMDGDDDMSRSPKRSRRGGYFSGIGAMQE